jgi:hypothetical protein
MMSRRQEHVPWTKLCEDLMLVVYNILAREVAVLAGEKKSPMEFEFRFDATALVCGVYFYRMKAGEFTAMKAFLLLK